MLRFVSSVCLVLVLCLASAASAKPRIAILGLEVIPGPSGAVDPTVTQVARDLTTDLRQRVQSEASPYALAQNSTKELTDEKLLKSCDNEAASCMAVIGASLAADYLLYGHIEKKGEFYSVAIRLLDVQTKSFQTTGESIAIGTPVVAMSKRLYAKVFGETVVSARPPDKVDSIVEQKAPPGPPRHPAVWKWSLGGSVALALGGAGLAYYSYVQMNKMQYTTVRDEFEPPDRGDCGKRAGDVGAVKGISIEQGDLDRACTWQTRHYVGFAIAGVGAVGAVVSLIMLTREVSPAETRATGARGTKPGIAIAPIVGPDGAGATLRVHW